MKHIFCLFIYLLMVNPLLALDPLSKHKDENEDKKTVCLNMIVKNESHVIRRCLQSALPFIDTWVIVDTGSTDGTQNIIKEFMRINQIPGELHERPWIDFGTNRQEALMIAKEKADYIMFMDADDVLVYPKNFELPELIHDVYLVQGIEREMQFHLWLLVKATHDWHWQDPIHEHLVAEGAPDDSLVGGILNGIEYHYLHDGARSKNPATLGNDIKVLTQALEKDSSNKRMTYYLAQTYLSSNNYHKALEFFDKRIVMKGNPEEVFSAMMYKAKVQAILNTKQDDVISTYQKALEYRPTRPEPIYYLSRYARIKGDFQKGYEIAKLGIDLPLSTDTLDLEYATYNGIILEYAYCCLELSKWKECKRSCKILASKTNLTQEQKENLKAISTLINDRLSSNEALNIVNKFYGVPS